MDIITAIHELTRFDHAVCDAQIVARHMNSEHLMVKNGSSFEGVYVGSAFITVWLAIIFAQTVRAYRDRRTPLRRDRPWLWIGPLMCTFGVVVAIIQAKSLIDYAATCRSLLHLS